MYSTIHVRYSVQFFFRFFNTSIAAYLQFIIFFLPSFLYCFVNHRLQVVINEVKKNLPNSSKLFVRNFQQI